MRCLVEFKPRHGTRIPMEQMEICVPEEKLAPEWAKRQLAAWSVDAEDVRVIITPIAEEAAKAAAPEKKVEKAPKAPKGKKGKAAKELILAPDAVIKAGGVVVAKGPKAK